MHYGFWVDDCVYCLFVKRRRGRTNLRWKDARKRDMTEVGLKRTTRQTGQHWGIRSSAIPATPDDGTSQGRRRISYNGGAVYFALSSGWVKHTLNKGLNRRTAPESSRLVEMWLIISSATISTTESSESNTKENTLRTRKDSANQSHWNASGCNTAHGIDFCVQRAPLSSVQGHACSGVDYRPVNTFVDSVFGENTQLCNLRYVHVFICLYLH